MIQQLRHAPQVRRSNKFTKKKEEIMRVFVYVVDAFCLKLDATTFGNKKNINYYS